jgi:hypothetical protein
MPECRIKNCDKSIKAKGLCSRHLSQHYRKQKALEQLDKHGEGGSTNGHLSRQIYIAGRDYNGPLEIGLTNDCLKSLEGKGLGLFGCFFARPNDAQIVYWDVKEKLEEFGLTIEQKLFDIDLLDARGLVRKCALQKSLLLFSEAEFYRLTMEYKMNQASDFSFWGQGVVAERWELEHFKVDEICQIIFA